MSNIKYKTAIYMRLSKGNDKNTESESIINQRSIIYDYVKAHPELQICDEMVDDGFSGSNSERPEFKRLLSEILDGNINCVIVKDLSRFSRDYVLSGNYLEKLFPSLGVRFISVNDNIDSHAKHEDSNFVMSLKSIMNDVYNRDISMKVRKSLDAKRKRGEYIGSFAPFGYLKSPDNHNKLIIDDEAKNTVKTIFFMCLRGISCADIANKLFLTDTRRPQSSENAYEFSGLVLCADCKQNMIRKTAAKGDKNIYYVCSTYRQKRGCFGHNINIKIIEKIVLDKINEHLDNADNKESFIKKVTDEINALSENTGEVFVFDENGRIKELTRLLLVMLIDRIYVTHEKELLIDFNSFD